jgi:SAM-dependent methyltransferase
MGMRRFLQLVGLARNRLRSKEAYVDFQRFQAQWVLDDLRPEVSIEGRALDLGCGMGGYSIELAKYARVVFAVDLHIPSSFPHNDRLIPINADARRLPFREDTFDFIFCSSFIEHMPDQRDLITRLGSILKPNGVLYLSFPPFYSLVGGHQFKLFHLLGEKVAVVVLSLLKRKRVKGYNSAFGRWGLYPITIRKARMLIEDTQLFQIVKIRPRFLRINTAVLPWLGEALTWHVEFISRKRSTGVSCQ